MVAKLVIESRIIELDPGGQVVDGEVDPCCLEPDGGILVTDRRVGRGKLEVVLWHVTHE